ncbi:type II secretion system protein GspG [Pelomonas sp. Root662]|nr:MULTISPECIES: type II secretion system major pseudopilin GspG [unclassified Roseateles]KQW42927.1 type II secretion system protein GspG [Pelomonas sp. Root405]KRA69605.1 type II secretion system protein GspG [Pelomonas sp. Root662]
MKRLTSRRRGFTLLELLVVILIIGMLTGIVAPRLMGQIGRSERTVARGQIDALDKAIESFRLDLGRYPTNAEGLQALVQAQAADSRWRGPYLKGGVPMDPWGSPYQYRSPGSSGRDFDLVSLGRDRAAGGSGDDADITN